MKLTKDMVAKTTSGTPDHLAMYANDVTGPSAVAIAAKMCVLHGRKVRLAACNKKGGEDPEVVEIFEFGTVPNRKCVRYCGENGNPLGAGSHTLYGDAEEQGDCDAIDVVEVATKMAWAVAKSGNSVFRLA